MKKKNFTLVELLCAVALVVILAGIGFSAYSYASYRGKEAATKSLITRLGAALETLKTKHGFYPAANGYSNITLTQDSNTGLITKVSFGSHEISNAAQLKSFLSVVDGESLKKHLSNNMTLTDAWGGEIKYKYPGSINTVKFDIIAPGADGEFTRSNQNSPGSTIDNYKENGEWACDDIANFK